MSLNSDEVNFLVYRYMLESGYTHSAFTFGIESHISQSNIEGSLVPPGALVNIIQKGMFYTEAELTVGDDGTETEMTEPLSLIDAVMPQNVPEVPNKIKIKIEPNCDENDPQKTNGLIDLANLKTKRDKVQLSPDRYTILRGHEAEVFTCYWNRNLDILATGSGDGTARLWDMTHDSMSPACVVLKHRVEKDMINLSGNIDVTSIDWNPDGNSLATGSYDGFARIWNLNGSVSKILGKHRGPIFVLKWNSIGKHIITAGVDRTCMVWDVDTQECIQHFKFHTAAALDVDWKTDDCFVSCGADNAVLVCSLGTTVPIRNFKGHIGEVNSVKWCPNKTLLASCSDDMTLKIWSMDQNTCVRDFVGHSKEIYAIRWNPDTTNMNSMIASASFDYTVRLWDVEHNILVNTLAGHTESVYSIAFSPDGKYIASGSFDKSILIWSTATAELIHSSKTDGGVFDVSWNLRGDRVSGSTSDGKVYVLDLRKM